MSGCGVAAAQVELEGGLATGQEGACGESEGVHWYTHHDLTDIQGSSARPGMRMRRGCAGTLVHYEQTLRLSGKEGRV